MDEELEIVETVPPLHPGEILREEFMKPFALTPAVLAKAAKVPRARIERISREDLGISADMALRLGRLFGIDPQFWLNLQARYDVARARTALGATLDGIAPLSVAA